MKLEGIIAPLQIGFVSHCAPDGVAAAEAAPEKLTVAKLRAALGARGWPAGELKKTAKKAELVAALKEAMQAEPAPATQLALAAATITPPATPAKPSAIAAAGIDRGSTPSRRGKALPVPGIAGLEGRETSAAAAAAEKMAAGEKGNVEHIALTDGTPVASSKKRGARGGGGGGGGSAPDPDTPAPPPSVRRRASP